MASVAVFLFVALVCAGCIIVVLLSALFDYARKRDDAEDRADRAEDQADALQVELNAALGRLSRKRKPSVGAGAA